MNCFQQMIGILRMFSSCRSLGNSVSSIQVPRSSSLWQNAMREDLRGLHRRNIYERVRIKTKHSRYHTTYRCRFRRRSHHETPAWEFLLIKHRTSCAITIRLIVTSQRHGPYLEVNNSQWNYLYRTWIIVPYQDSVRSPRGKWNPASEILLANDLCPHCVKQWAENTYL